MSEFEKELEKNMELNKVAYKRENIYSGFLISKRDIERVFHDWQPPKPLLKIPQFMADWFEYQLKNNNLDKFDGNTIFRIIQDVIKVSNDEDTWEYHGITDKIAKFAEDNEELFLNLIVNCSLGYGYTFDKEKKYILKHIDLSEQNNIVSVYLAHSQNGKLQHERFSKDIDMSEIERCHFTQTEIDKLNIGSYEQIEVEP